MGHTLRHFLGVLYNVVFYDVVVGESDERVHLLDSLDIYFVRYV